ncbi:hypothetical protein ACEPAF_2653 [Sanghuangporus sanghuang]
MAATASLQHPQARPRPLSAYSLDSAASGPYLSAHPSTSVASVPRRTSSSQTFRPSPLAGPVLSYTSLFELDTSTSASTSSHSHESSLSVTSSASSEGLLKPPQRCKSTGALATLDEDRLQPPMPAWTRSSRRSVVSVHSSRSFSSTSSTSSIPTHSSLISVSVSEEPEPRGTYSGDSHRVHVHRPPALRLSEADTPDLYAAYRTTPTSSLSLPTRRHSRLCFSPSPLLSPASSERTSPTPSLCSATSTSSTSSYITGGTEERSGDCRRVRIQEHRRVRIQEHETTREEYVSSKTEKQRRRSSLPVPALAPVDKHDWLTATPTPIFSRSALRTQGVIMPVSARDHQRSRTSSTSSPDVHVRNDGKRDGDKAKVEELRVPRSGKPKISAGRDDDDDRKLCGGGGVGGADGSEAKVKSTKSLGLAVNVHLPRRRRSILIRVPSFASFLSPSSLKNVKEEPNVDGIVNEAREDKFGKRVAGSSDSESSSTTSSGDAPPPSSSDSSSSSISDPPTDFPSSSSSSSTSLPTPTSNPSLSSPPSSIQSSAGPTSEASHSRPPKPPIHKLKPDPKQSKGSGSESTRRANSENSPEKEKSGLGLSLSFTHHSSLRDIWRKLSVRARERVNR